MLEKVHRIQRAGLEVWSGMIVGFDSDDERVFEEQRRFVQEARIIQAMINTLVAIPRTPLYARLEREGRLDNSGEMGDFGTLTTNVALAKRRRPPPGPRTTGVRRKPTFASRLPVAGPHPRTA
jgi:hypothetical protein